MKHTVLAVLCLAASGSCLRLPSAVHRRAVTAAAELRRPALVVAPAAVRRGAGACMTGSSVPGRDLRIYDRLESIMARGIASFAITRSILQTGVSISFAVPPIVLALVAIYFTPVAAVESSLLAVTLVLSGAAKYWPINFLVLALGAIGLGGFVNACLQWGDAAMRSSSGSSSARRRQGAGRKGRVAPRRAPTPQETTDNETALITLVVGSIFAAVIGALP